ncbi:MAG TPA: prepilin-type N-terminal cleavage/methylation domain-containing protein [Mollicutes bacterium]|nr:prepilin-type N-terminal cleavage/methylation domain-containing protein [Mollicutes bacterium]
MNKVDKKKINAFTLIELLAVIVILAVIIAIAVPQIGKIVDSSTK